MTVRRWYPAAAVTVVACAGLLAGLLAGCTDSSDAPGSDESSSDVPSTGVPSTSVPSTGAPASPVPLPEPVPLPSPVPLPAPVPPGAAPPAPTPPEVALDRDNRALLAQARRSGQPVVILLVATEPGRTAEARGDLERLGGVISSAEPAVGYLRVSMPTEHVERAAAAPAVAAVDIDQLIPRENPRPQGS